MIKKINRSKMFKKIEQLQSKVESKSSIPIVLSLETWLNSDDKCSTFGKYALGVERKNQNATIIVDDMVIQTDMYINTGLILNSDRETIKSFVNLAEDENEIEYMKEYIKLFHDWMGVDEPEPKSQHIKKLHFYNDKSIWEGGRWLTREELLERSFQNELKSYELHIETTREVLSESREPFYLDFFDHYRVLSAEELVERYKDQRFSKLQS